MRLRTLGPHRCDPPTRVRRPGMLVLEKRHHKRGTARFGCLRRFCLSTHSASHSESFDGQSAIVCVRELVCREGGAGCSPTDVHRASACTLNAVAWGSCPCVEMREDRPPLPHHFVCVEKFTFPSLPLQQRRTRRCSNR